MKSDACLSWSQFCHEFFLETNYGANVLVRVPVPQSTATISLDTGSVAQGQLAEYRENDKQVRWVVKKFTGGSEHTLRAKINLGSAATPHTRREVGPISLSFEIPMYNVSNVQVCIYNLVVDKAMTHC